MDFPNVTHVFQFGLPMNGEQYIHRLGRTGRAGKSGVGYTVLYPFEAPIFNHYKEVKSLPIQKTKAPEVAEKTVKAVHDAIRNVDIKIRNQAYAAWLGYYKVYCGKMKWTPEMLVSHANEMALEAFGCEELPGMDPRYVPSCPNIAVIFFFFLITCSVYDNAMTNANQICFSLQDPRKDGIERCQGTTNRKT